jgi:type II secretion system protein G
MRRLHRGQSGFTLIELLVVVAIIGLLAAFAVPRLFEAINKSKKAPGEADMQTISSALERHYFDNNAYPHGDADDVMDALKGTYVKANTTFHNGFNKGYLYISDDKGGFYILVDPQKNSGDVTVECGAYTSVSVTIDTKFVAKEDSNSPSPDDLKAGCTVKDSSGTALSDVSVITN